MEAAVSFFVSTIGLQIPFVITDVATGLPISNALSANVVWVANNGVHRQLTLTSPVSGEFVYITGPGDFRTPRTEEGYLSVSYGTNVFYTSAFAVVVHAHF